MKYSVAFISNSSSSSYVCDICHNCDSAYDASPSDLGFYECKKSGHIVCQGDHWDYERDNEDQEKMNNNDQKSSQEDEDEDEEQQISTDSDHESSDDCDTIDHNCPLCMCCNITDSDLLRVYEKISGINISGLKQRIYSSFQDSNQFELWMQQSKNILPCDVNN